MIIIKKISYKNHNILFIYTSIAILRAKRICKYMNSISIS